MYDDSYNNDMSEYDSDLLEAEADLLLGEDLNEDDEADILLGHKKPHLAGEDELEDIDGFEDDLDAFDFHDDLGGDELADEDM